MEQVDTSVPSEEEEDVTEQQFCPEDLVVVMDQKMSMNQQCCTITEN